MTGLKCPFCGRLLEYETYRDYRIVACILYCPNGDFCTKEENPTQCMLEYEAAVRSAEKIKDKG